MGLFRKKEKSSKVKFIEGIERFTKGEVITLSLDEDKECLVMKNLNKQIGDVYLKYEQVIMVKYMHEREIVEANKSTIGRAAVGGLLLGEVGALAGAASSAGTKKKEKLKTYIIINYKNKKKRKEKKKVLSFETTNSNLYIVKIIKKLNEKSKLIENMYL